MKFSIRKLILLFSLIALYTWLLVFNEIEVVAPGEGITSVLESDVVINSPSSAYVVSIGVSQGQSIKVGQSMLVYRNLEDEYRLDQLKESLDEETINHRSLKDEQCFLNSEVFADALKEQTHYDVLCAEHNYKGGAGGFYILQYYEDYLLEKKFFNDLKYQRKKRIGELLKKEKVLLKKRKALKRGQGATIMFYDLESEISDLKNDMISFKITGLENEKLVRDKFSIFELRRSERLLTIEEKLEKLSITIIEKKHQKELLLEKIKLSVIRSPLEGNVLNMTEGIAPSTFVEAGSPLFVLKKKGASQNVQAKFATRYRHFLKIGNEVNLKIDSAGFNRVFKGKITEISSDSIEYEDSARAGKRFYRVNITPEQAFVNQSLNLGIDVRVMVVTDEITAFEYIYSVLPNTVNFNVW